MFCSITTAPVTKLVFASSSFLSICLASFVLPSLINSSFCLSRLNVSKFLICSLTLTIAELSFTTSILPVSVSIFLTVILRAIAVMFILTVLFQQ